jgi:hypothetical protein
VQMLTGAAPPRPGAAGTEPAGQLSDATLEAGVAVLLVAAFGAGLFVRRRRSAGAGG